MIYTWAMISASYGVPKPITIEEFERRAAWEVSIYLRDPDMEVHELEERMDKFIREAAERCAAGYWRRA